MSAPSQAHIRKLTQGMLNKKLYAVLRNGNGADLIPYLAEHLAFMVSLEREGKVFRLRTVRSRQQQRRDDYFARRDGGRSPCDRIARSLRA
jgi:hypothetical protein